MGNAMNAKDAISGSLAKCFVTLEENRYEFMQMTNFEAKVNINISEVPILGKTMKGHKATSGSGEWSANLHYNQSIMRRLILDYKKTGVFPYFDIQVTNEDPTSEVGRQTVILKQCLFEGGILAKFDADAETLDEEIGGTFDDFEMPEEFTMLSGMQ